MTTSTSIGDQVAFHLIASDLLFARRYIQSAINRNAERQHHVPMFCMLNYVSLYIYESHKAMQTINPQEAAQLAVYDAPIIERSRHSVKFFDDTNAQHGGVEGVATQFEEIIQAHRSFYLGNTWFPPAQALETDLAVYRYRDRLVSTTHAISFYPGLPPATIRDPTAMGQAMKSLAEDQARYIARLVETLSWQGSSFMDSLSLNKVTNKDIRAARFYANAFDAGLAEKVTAVLTAFQCAMNFLDLMLSEEANPYSSEAVFKLKFITLYHVLSSLAKLKSLYGSILSSGSSSALDAILSHQLTNEITRRDRKGLRNVLIHYLPLPQVVAQLSPAKPLCGLIEAYYPGYDYVAMSQAIDEHTRHIAKVLDDWSNQPE